MVRSTEEIRHRPSMIMCRILECRKKQSILAVGNKLTVPDVKIEHFENKDK